MHDYFTNSGDWIRPDAATAAAAAAEANGEFHQIDGAVPGSSNVEVQPPSAPIVADDNSDATSIVSSSHYSEGWINADTNLPCVLRFTTTRGSTPDAVRPQPATNIEPEDDEMTSTDDEEGHRANAEARRRLLADTSEEEEEEVDDFIEEYAPEPFQDHDDDDDDDATMSNASLRDEGA